MQIASYARRLPLLVLADGEVRYSVAGPTGRPGGLDRFAFGDEQSWQQPQALGKAFAEHLRGKGHSARWADVVLLPADWAVLRTLSLPPAQDPSLVGGMVDLAADEAFAERRDDLACGYQAASNPMAVEASIFACPRDRLDAVRTFCQAAGLKPACVAPLSAAAAAGLTPAKGQALLVLAQGDRLLLAVAQDRRCVWQRVVVAPPDGSPEALSAELHRAALAMPLNGSAARVVLGEPALAETISRALGPPGGASSPPQPTEALLSIPAHVVADLKASTLNLLGTGESAIRQKWLRRAKRVAPLAAVAVILLAAFAWNWSSAAARAADAQATLGELADRVHRAEELQSFQQTSEPWFRPGAPYLEAMKALAEHFPEQGDIWLTSLTADESGEITLTGKARRRSDVLDLLGKLGADKRFSQVAQHSLREQTGRQTVVTFSLSCRAVKGEQP